MAEGDEPNAAGASVVMPGAGLQLKRVRYEDLNARQQENFNYHKLSAVLADFGFTTIRLSDDWNGADMIALHRDGEPTLRVQLKGRLCFHKKYLGKGLHVAFRDGESDWYLYPHDALLEVVLAETGIAETESWQMNGGYAFPGLSRQMRPLLEPYLIPRPVES